MSQLNVDCLKLIFNKLQNKKSLHSCLLVNRMWCHLVVPILWKKYSWCNSNVEVWYTGIMEKKFLNVVISCLSSSSKKLLSDNDIKLPSTILLKPPLFNYLSFCEFPRAKLIDRLIRIVFGKLNSYDKRNLVEQEIYKLFVSQCEDIKKLHWETTQPLSLLPGALTCFSQLYSLSIEVNLVTSNSLYEMAQICKDLDALSIYECSHDIPGLITLIDAQRNLKIVNIFRCNNRKGSCEETSKALARKGNAINCLYLDSDSNISPSFLTSLINLKTLSIRNDKEHLNTTEEIKELRQYFAISEFPNLQYLAIGGFSCFKELEMLIEKTKGNVTDISIFSVNGDAAGNTGTLIKAIANNCPKINFLHIYLEPKDFIHIKLLLLNCRYLESINFNSLDLNDNIGDELLDILTKFSPKSLNDVTIFSQWTYSTDSLIRYFESCRGRPLRQFCIYDMEFYSHAVHREIVSDYIQEGVIKSSCMV